MFQNYLDLYTAYLYSCFVFLLVFSACSKKTVDVQKEDTIHLQESPSILFLDLQVTKAQKNKYIVEIANQIITEGKFKSETTHDLKPIPGDLQIRILDQNRSELLAHHIVQPLKQRFEFVGPDGQLVSSETEVEEKIVSLRTSLPPASRFIRIDVLLEDYTYYTLLNKEL